MSVEQIEQQIQRLPASEVPCEPDYFDNLKRQLADERAPKACVR